MKRYYKQFLITFKERKILIVKIKMNKVTCSPKMTEMIQESVNSNSSLLLNHFGQHVVDQQPVATTNCFRYSKGALETSAVAAACIGRVPYWSTSASASSNPVWGGILAFVSVSCWMSVCSIWMLDLATGKMRPLSAAEKKMYEEEQASQKKSSTKKHCLTALEIAEKITIIGLGFLAQFPYAAIGYRNNGNSIFFGVVPFLDAGLTMYSLSLTSANVKKSCCNKVAPNDRKYIDARDKFIEYFEAYRASLPDLYRKGDPLLDIANDPIGFIESILSKGSNSWSPPSEASWPAKAAGCILGASQLWIYGLATRDGMKLITDNEAGQYAGVAGVTVVNAWLEGSAPTQSIQNIWNRMSGARRNTIATACFPRFRAVLSGVDLVASGLCYSFPYKISEQEMVDKLEPGVWPVKVMSSFGNAMVVTGALETVFDRLTIALAKSRWFGDDKKRKLIATDKLLASFITVVQNASAKEFKNLLGNLSKDSQQLLLGEDYESPKRLDSEKGINTPRAESRVRNSDDDGEGVESGSSWDDDSLLTRTT